MPTDSTTSLKAELKQKDKEIKELKEMLAEAEAELKEYTSSDNLIRPRASMLESRTLNKVIKATFFILLCAIIIMAGLYPWLFKDKIFGGEQVGRDDQPAETVMVEETAEDADAMTEADADTTGAVTEPTTETPVASKQLVEVASDLGWLNVRTEPSAEGDIIKKINSDERYEWVEKTADNWYKLIIDEQGHTGYASGEYLIEQ